MESTQFEPLIEILRNKGIQFANGVTDIEFSAIQKVFNITFPPDLKLFLQVALPISDGFVDWRGGLNSNELKEKICHRIEWPLDGILFDVENNQFWMESWGDMPDSHRDKERIVKRKFVEYPKLAPIYSHRFIPSDPAKFDNPIFSVHQTDVIYYGYNLTDYFAKEFSIELPCSFNIPFAPIRDITFWSDLTAL